MADENVIIEENEQNVGEYDPNPYDNVTVEEALKQLFNRFTPRTVRQAIFTMAENNKPATLIDKTITENGTYNASADNADGYSKVTVDVAGGGGREVFEVDFTANFETEEITASKTYAQALTAIQNNDIINFTINTPFPCIYGGCFICSNSVTEKDDMYFILTPNTPAFMDEEGIIIHNEAIIWTETGISIRSYDYNP